MCFFFARDCLLVFTRGKRGEAVGGGLGERAAQNVAEKQALDLVDVEVFDVDARRNGREERVEQEVKLKRRDPGGHEHRQPAPLLPPASEPTTTCVCARAREREIAYVCMIENSVPSQAIRAHPQLLRDDESTRMNNNAHQRRQQQTLFLKKSSIGSNLGSGRLVIAPLFAFALLLQQPK